MSVSTPAAPRLALVGDRGNHDEPAHPKIDALLPHEGVDAHWVATTELRDAGQLDGFDGIWLVPGAPYRNQRGVHTAVRHARERGLPFLGTCGGFYSALIEYAQNVLRVPEAEGVDEQPERMLALVTPLMCSVQGEPSALTLREGSVTSAVYGGATTVEEVLHCDYALPASFLEAATAGRITFTAWDVDGAPRALELSGHPFFLGSLFQPELRSSPGSVHPLVGAFLDAVRTSAGTPAGR